MQPSDWIAIAALAASVIISIAGFWFNYKTNQENIKARRADIAVEKSIEAFRELIEKIYNLLNTEGEEKDKTVEAKIDCLNAFSRNQLYFPNSISLVFTQLMHKVDRLFANNLEGVYDQRDDFFVDFRELIDRMQKHIGLETEEIPVRKKSTKNYFFCF